MTYSIWAPRVRECHVGIFHVIHLPMSQGIKNLSKSMLFWQKKPSILVIFVRYNTLVSRVDECLLVFEAFFPSSTLLQIKLDNLIVPWNIHSNRLKFMLFQKLIVLVIFVSDNTQALKVREHTVVHMTFFALSTISQVKVDNFTKNPQNMHSKPLKIYVFSKPLSFGHFYIL